MTPAGQPRADAVAVVQQLVDAGHRALFAGGCVRDELLGLIPKDYDVATDATPDRVREVFGRHRTRAVGAAFGVILVREGASQIEVATFRTDGDYRDGRRPDTVRFSNAREDAERRDFTINGLFRDPLAGEDDPRDDGIIDHVGGRRDLKARLLRCIGDPSRRFGEDYLRLLRAVRFASRFGLSVEPRTWNALRDHAHRIGDITPERVGDELRRMLAVPTRGEAWRLLWEGGLISHVFRGMAGMEFELNRHRPITRELASLPGEIEPTLAIAGTLLELAGHAGAPPSAALDPQAARQLVGVARDALRLSNAETNHLANTLDLAPLLLDEVPSIALLRRFLATPASGDAIVLMRAIRHDSELRPRIDEVLEQLREPRDGAGESAPEPWVRGDDLIAAGVKPGPRFKPALDAAYDAQLDGSARDREDALRIALDVIGV